MSAKCPKCGKKISSVWLVYSAANEKYRCVDCCSLIGWSDQYRRYISWILFIATMCMIFGKKIATENGYFTDATFVQDVLVIVGFVFTIMHFKLLIPLQRSVALIDSSWPNKT